MSLYFIGKLEYFYMLKHLKTSQQFKEFEFNLHYSRLFNEFQDITEYKININIYLSLVCMHSARTSVWYIH